MMDLSALRTCPRREGVGERLCSGCLPSGSGACRALGAAATVIVVGGCIGNGFRGIEHSANAQLAASRGSREA